MKQQLHFFALLLTIEVIFTTGVFGQWFAKSATATTENLDSMAYAEYSTALEGVIVEPYYISDEADYEFTEEEGDGTLPVGSKTYRIYIDLKPGYGLQAVFGSSRNVMELKTTTLFYNNFSGSSSAANIIDNTLKNGSIMVDSWLTITAGSKYKGGVLKSEDTDGAIINDDDILQNDDLRCGIPISERDGLIPDTTAKITAVGDVSTLLDIFDEHTAGNEFVITNGAWTVLSAIAPVGPTPDNRVLIGQFTTDGEFSFKLNIQVQANDTISCKYCPQLSCNCARPMIQFVHTLHPDDDTLIGPRGEEGLKVIVQDTLLKQMPIINNNNRIFSECNNFKVYPNPANDFVNVVLPADYSSKGICTIYNLYGKVAVEKTINQGKHAHEIDIRALQPGVYIIAVKVNGTLATQRLIVR